MRKFPFLVAILSIGFSGLSYGQEILIDLQSYPVKKIELKKSNVQAKAKSTLSLPFFDDFPRGFSTPDHDKWSDSFVLINQNYSINPPTIGVATFDAINQYGKLYEHLTTSSLPADTLTSQPINLSFQEKDSLYLSFQYQPKGLGKEPKATDSIVVEFLSKDDNKWILVWAALPHFENNTIVEHHHLEKKVITRKASAMATRFFKVMLPIKDERFRKDGFRFRYINYASLSENTHVPSIRGNGDQWHIDLVYLDTSRYLTDTILNDVAFSKPIKSLLKNYETIPWKHFTSQAKQSELTDPLTFNIQFRNLTPIKWNITKDYLITDLSNLTPPVALTGGADNYDPYQTVDFPNNYEYTFNSNWEDSAKFEMKSYLTTESGDKYLRWNDTTSYTQKFINYYSYDDGTAENGYGLFGEGSQNGMIALKYHSYVSDSLKGVLIYFNQIADFSKEKKWFDLAIWSDKSGKPNEIIYRKTVSKPTYAYNTDTLYKISSKLKLGGDFWIGTINSTTDMLNIGFDMNNNHKDKLYYNLSGSWTNSQFDGSLMMKPVFGKFALGQTAIDKPTTRIDFTIYPNPATNHISLNLPEGEQPERIRIVNLAGRIVLSKNYDNNSIDISNLPTGIYLFQLTLHNQTTTTKKLVIIK